LLESVRPASPMRAVVTLLAAEENMTAKKAAVKQALDNAWNCVQRKKTPDEIDRDIAAMRGEWIRAWEK
jgi:hypothetical protein